LLGENTVPFGTAIQVQTCSVFQELTQLRTKPLLEENIPVGLNGNSTVGFEVLRDKINPAAFNDVRLRAVIVEAPKEEIQ